MIKINLNEELGIEKPFEIKQTNKRVEDAYKFQLENARFQLYMSDLSNKLDAIDDDAVLEPEEEQKLGNDITESYQKQLDHLNSLTNYIINTLKLNKSQAKLLEELEVSATDLLANRICSKMLGSEPKDVKEQSPEA